MPRVLRRQLRVLIHSLRDQDILSEGFDNHFNQDREDHRYLLNLIIEFIEEADQQIALSKSLIDRPAVHYRRFSRHVVQLEECSTSLGCGGIVSDCQLLQRASSEKDKHRCVALFERLERDYEILRENLNRICMLARANTLPW